MKNQTHCYNEIFITIVQDKAVGVRMVEFKTQKKPIFLYKLWKVHNYCRKWAVCRIVEGPKDNFLIHFVKIVGAGFEAKV